MNSIEEINELKSRQHSFFASGITRDLNFRKESLRLLEQAIIKYDAEIAAALKKDLNKSSFETYATETGLVLHELRTQIRNLSKWAGPLKVRTPLFALPSRSMIVPEPLGQVLIISPWNYPFQLPLIPAIGAIAAGNVVIMRQSRFSPATNSIIKILLKESFDENHILVIDCDTDTAEETLKLNWDLIFFTGSTTVGQKIYSAAAANLTPVILELGGKSPVIVAEDADLNIAARRIIWGKLINAGQTCIAPDYLFVHASMKERLIEKMKSEILQMYEPNPLENPDYPRIISEKAFDRLSSYLINETIIAGGRTKREQLSIEPTLINATLSDKIMDEEIFGPLLPVITYTEIDEVISHINSKDKPLALYIFSSDRKKQNKMINETSSGACLVNDVILHIANGNLPFGGVGKSGMGRYHGKESFRSFSNMKAVMKSSTVIDISLKYPPFKNKERLIRRFLR